MTIRRAITAASISGVLGLTSCSHAEELSRYDSAAEVMDDVIASGAVECASRMDDESAHKSVDELSGDERAIDICFNEERNHPTAIVHKDISGKEYIEREWGDSDTRGGAAVGENWAFECQYFEDISESECERVASEMGGEFVTFG